MKGRVFLDTNILLYALTKPKDQKEMHKREISLNVLTQNINSRVIVVSAQVLNELHWNLTRKFHITDNVAFDIIQENVISIALVEDLSFKTYTIAYELRKKYNLSFWDSLILASAIDAECNLVYTEDMQNGLVIDSYLKISNPFSSPTVEK